MAAPNNHTGSSPKVIACNCNHEYQDAKYGKGQRLHNPRKGDTWACTVCGKVVGK